VVKEAVVQVESVVEERCHCGALLGHRGRHRGSQTVSIEKSVTHSEKITVEECPSPIEIRRKVEIIVPGEQPETQVQLTPEIADAVWKSLSKEQRYDLLDMDDQWDNGYDDDMKMLTINKVLLIHKADYLKEG
jgi:hypothetical protein